MHTLVARVRASLAELAKLVTDCPSGLDAYVLFFQPHGGGNEWRDTDLSDSARQIPGIHVIADDDGRERERFGVQTSGHVLVYAAGKLAFSGGITPSRGHSGDNAGREAIVELVGKGSAVRKESLVFGCPLCNRSPVE